MSQAQTQIVGGFKPEKPAETRLGSHLAVAGWPGCGKAKVRTSAQQSKKPHTVRLFGLPGMLERRGKWGLVAWGSIDRFAD